MSKFFSTLVVVDLFALCVPTKWLGASLEMALAIGLGIVTGSYWLIRWVNK